MSLTLLPNQICPYSKNCPYTNTINSYCNGSDPKRDTVFTCEFINEQGVFLENKFRSSKDITGKMKVLHE